MAFDLITVAVFGLKDKDKLNEIILPNMAPYEANSFEFYTYDNDSNLNAILCNFTPHVILTFGDSKDFGNIWNLSLEFRKRWIHIDPNQNIEGEIIASQIAHCFMNNTLDKTRFLNCPLISVFTPTYKTGDKIQRPYKSLLEQTYTNWEWIVYDDSPNDDNGKTYNEMCALAETDPRIKVFKGHRHSGKIGEIKKRCCGLASGSILAELDHDDELTNNCL